MKRKVRCGNVTFGDGNVYVQSMLNVLPDDVDGNVRQALELQGAGCDVIRVSVPEPKDAALVYALKNAVAVPIVADIHFNAKCALEAVSAGADKIRLNPGNFPKDKLAEIVSACNARQIPIRVGLNGGSLEKGNTFLTSAANYINKLEQLGFENIVLSAKASDVKTTIALNRELHNAYPYPLHIGVTEAGTTQMGIVKSAIGIGALLSDGIGDTIRVSLTAPPVDEVYAAHNILKAVGLRGGVNVISCPTCGRTRINIARLADEVNARFGALQRDITIAVMGCAVNGPGEARNADYGIAGGDGEGLLFARGEIIRKVPEDELLAELENLINNPNYF